MNFKKSALITTLVIITALKLTGLFIADNIRDKKVRETNEKIDEYYALIANHTEKGHLVPALNAYNEAIKFYNETSAFYEDITSPLRIAEARLDIDKLSRQRGIALLENSSLEDKTSFFWFDRIMHPIAVHRSYGI